MCRFGFVTSQLFYLSTCARPFWCVFFLADQHGIVCFPKSVRFELPNVIEILKLLWEDKKQNVQILTNGGYKIVE